MITIRYLCLECNNDYYVRPSRAKTSKFCGKGCQHKYEAKSLLRRYQEKVDKRGPDECWPWLAYADKDGYGQIRVDGRRTKPAHRVGYELEHGPIPDNILVCHTCDNPPCQNPTHWFIGTNADNMTDKVSKGRWNGGRKLTDTQILEIFNLKGKEQPRITAERYNISRSRIYDIQRNYEST